MRLRFGRDMHAHKLADVLPERFGPHSVLKAGQKLALLLEPQFHDVHLAVGGLPMPCPLSATQTAHQPGMLNNGMPSLF